MATLAASYQEFVDPGLALTAEAVTQYDPLMVCQDRMKDCWKWVLVWHRRNALYTEWIAKEVSRVLVYRTTHYAMALGLSLESGVGYSKPFDAIEALSPEQMKAMNKAAHGISPVEWLAERAETLGSMLRLHCTMAISRSPMSKGEVRPFNQVAERMKSEITSLRDLQVRASRGEKESE